jgi:hypothetical protein
MAKSKAELHAEAVASGAVGEDTEPDDFTVAQLEVLLSADVPAYEGSLMYTEPQVAPDGHVNLSQEDIDARA